MASPLATRLYLDAGSSCQPHLFRSSQPVEQWNLRSCAHGVRQTLSSASDTHVQQINVMLSRATTVYVVHGRGISAHPASLPAILRLAICTPTYPARNELRKTSTNLRSSLLVTVVCSTVEVQHPVYPEAFVHGNAVRNLYITSFFLSVGI